TVINGTESGTQQVTATITDDDLPPAVAFNAAVSSGSESVTAVAVPVSLSTASGRTVTVSYAVTGTATGGGVDYTLAAGTLTFAPGVTTQNISIAVVNDTLDEDDETIQLTLSGPTNATLGAIPTHTYTILDDDPPPSLSINNVSLTEGNSGTTNATFTVTLSAASSKTVTVSFATADGTALAGSDYTATNGVLTFNPGQTTRTVSVPVIGDAITELNETFVVTLSNPTNATFVNLSNPVNATIADGQGLGTIRSDDFIALFQGQSFGDPTWFGGPLLGWKEREYLPLRLIVSGGPATNQFFSVDFDHTKTSGSV